MARAQTQTIAKTMYEWRLEGMVKGGTCIIEKTVFCFPINRQVRKNGK